MALNDCVIVKDMCLVRFQHMVIILKLRKKSYGSQYVGSKDPLFVFKDIYYVQCKCFKVLKDIYSPFNWQLLLEATRLTDNLVFLA